jgi:pyrimidine deaminase RibD-like protein
MMPFRKSDHASRHAAIAWSQTHEDKEIRVLLDGCSASFDTPCAMQTRPLLLGRGKQGINGGMSRAYLIGRASFASGRTEECSNSGMLASSVSLGIVLAIEDKGRTVATHGSTTAVCQDAIPALWA